MRSVTCPIRQSGYAWTGGRCFGSEDSSHFSVGELEQFSVEPLTACDAALSVIGVGLKCYSAIFSIACGLLGCADLARWTRQYTYPPDFRYIERDQLRSAMWQLARHVRELDQHLRSPAAEEQQRRDVLEHLEGMGRATRALDTAGWPTNHPMIDMNMPKFRQDIRLAREAVERMPPSYALAQSLPGACLYCHGGR